ncbi:hypothetical protein [Vulcanisaeta thermophila]|uniref:hypothetical protein n=1 Tax=Vulcanisaeta thermophila TaxID=867917 RepID=UPI0008539A43|nr:hypothetical protein [Vulcanisaeta thermophila]
MDEVSGEARELLRRILVNGYVPLDSLSPSERALVDELLRGGYLRVYVGINGDRLGHVIELIGDGTIPRRRLVSCRGYSVIPILISMPTLYLSIRAFMMGIGGVGLFFIVMSIVIGLGAYYMINKWCLAITRALVRVRRLIKSLRS